MSVPFPDPVLISALSNLPALADDYGGRVSTVLDAVLPALRITKVGDAEVPTTDDAAPIYQVEVWADDEFTAGDIAWRLVNAWPSARRERVLDALVRGRWVEANPFPSPDPETETSRYLVSLGIRLSGASS